MIILDSGSTMFQLVEWLPEGITVITTDILVAVEIAKSEKDIQIVMPGGEVQKSVYSLQGADTIRFLQSLHADKLFFCCDALDFKFGISDRSREYAAVKQVMIDAVSEVILLVDSSKFDSRLGTKVCPMERLDVMIVDKDNSEMKKNCEKMGIKLVIAE